MSDPMALERELVIAAMRPLGAVEIVGPDHGGGFWIIVAGANIVSWFPRGRYEGWRIGEYQNGTTERCEFPDILDRLRRLKAAESAA